MNRDERNSERIELPRPTAAQLVLAAGVVLMVAGLARGWARWIAGGVVFAAALGTGIGHLLPGRGHFHEERVGRDERRKAIAPAPGTARHCKQARLVIACACR